MEIIVCLGTLCIVLGSKHPPKMKKSFSSSGNIMAENLNIVGVLVK